MIVKFVETDYEKIDKLIEIHDGARKRLSTTDFQIEKDKQVRLCDPPSDHSLTIL